MKVLHIVPNAPINEFVRQDARYLKNLKGIESEFYSINLLNQDKVGLDLVALAYSVIKSIQVRLRNFDVLHCHFLPSSIMGVTSQTPIVVTTHESADTYTSLWKAFFRFSLRKCSIINVSRYNREYWMRRVGFAGEVVYHAVDCEIYNPKRRSRILHEKISSRLGTDRWLLTMGALDKARGHEVLLNALAKLRNKGVHLGLVIKGYGGNPVYIRNFIHMINRSDVPTLLIRNHLPEESLAILMASCDAFVRPSFQESFGIAPLEAQACGVPVLANKCCSLSEVFRDSALFFRADNPIDLQDKINHLLCDEEIRLSIIERGLRNASELSWERKLDAYVEIYNKTIQAKQSETKHI